MAIEINEIQTTKLVLTLQDILVMLTDKYPDNFKGNETITGSVAVQEHDWDGDWISHKDINVTTQFTFVIKTSEA